jgi:GH25 family lysozyme M1 (1,4-beta-N-acetylmuramidase)
MNYIQGVDVSGWNPSVNWQKLRNQEIRFAFIKATEGTEPSNKYFDEQWSGAKSAGILRGAYHYLSGDIDGAAQADSFLSRVKIMDGDLPPALDLEEKGNENVPIPQFIANAQKWLERVEFKTRRQPIIYSRASFLGPWGSVPWGAKYQTWLAHYIDFTDRGTPTQPPGWGDWIFWQYSGDREKLDGIYEDRAGTILRTVDRNAYRHSWEELQKLARASAPMQKMYTVKAGDTLNSIAVKNGTTPMEIASLNNVKKTDIVPGKVLKLP